MVPAKLSLKALTVFLAVARRGVLQDAARDLGLSISTASHHLSELEKAVGTALFDHGHRPLRLTTAGETLHASAETALGHLQKGIAEIWSGDALSMARPLRFAMIEDFDADVAPALTQDLIDALPQCDLSLFSRPTHEILDLLLSEQIDLGLAATSDFDKGGFVEEPILRDPFILLVPAGLSAGPTQPDDLVRLAQELPFLRYSRRQLVGQRIEAQFRRMQLHLPRRMEFEATHVILSLVAAGHGWTVTTVLSFARAQRYHAQLRVLPFPGRAFAREISIFAREDLPQSVVDLTARSLRASIRRMVLDPTLARYPWLEGALQLLMPPRSAQPKGPSGSEDAP